LNVFYCENQQRLSAQAAALVIGEIERKPDLLLCAATGNSPIGLYEELVRTARAKPGLFPALRIIKLDEWGGLPEGGPGSAERYLRTRLLEPLGIPPERYISFSSTAADPSAECRRVRAVLEQAGPIDVCVLGLGVNGHIGFNEPGPVLLPQCHVAPLSEESRRHAMVRGMENPPRFGLTLGLQEILASRKIILLIAGEGKQPVIARLLSAEVSTTLPASFLWLHDNVDCLIDRTAQEIHQG
jgi:galactosamine-6-phosphate isomerase